MLRDRCRSVAKLRVIEAPRVQLTNGLKRTKEEPTSVPTLRPHYHAVESLKIRPVSSMQGRRLPVETHQFEVNANQITKWKAQLVEGAAGVFGGGSAEAPPVVDVKVLHAKIGELTLENDFLAGALNKAGMLSAKR